MASKSSSQSTDRPPAADVARELYKNQFGTSKPDAVLPAADAVLDPDADMGGAVDPSSPKES